MPLEVPAAVFTSLSEHLSRLFDIQWPGIVDFFELKHKQDIRKIEVPVEYACRPGTKTSSLSSFAQLGSHEHVLFTALTLEHATRRTHDILDSHTLNSSMDATVGKLELTWLPFCQRMRCDHTNHWDIFLASHAHTESLLELNSHADIISGQVKSRVRLDIRMQKFLGANGEAFASRHYLTEESSMNFRRMVAYFERLRTNHSAWLISVAQKMRPQDMARFYTKPKKDVLPRPDLNEHLSEHLTRTPVCRGGWGFQSEKKEQKKISGIYCRLYHS